MDFFELMAECSVALGGFAAVHSVLRGSTGPRGTFRAWGTVSWAFTALLMALVPPLVGTAGPLDAGDWVLIHGIGFALAAATMTTSIWIDVRLDREGHRAQVLVFLRAAQVAGVLGALLLLAALVGWPFRPGPVPYAIGLGGIFISGVLGITASFWVAMREAIGLGEGQGAREG